jgi:glycosyltransferase involved in cell wall biosynthesis
MACPLVTVITPAFNVEEYLAETVECVLAQSERDFEYLIVDDGSTDRTREIAEHYAGRDHRVRVVQGDHRGSSAARNLALREARGRFIAFCDGDDRWAPTFLETSLRTLGAAPAEVGATFAGASYIDQSGVPSGRFRIPAPGDYDAERMLAQHCPPGNGSSLLIRASCFDEAGLFDENLFNCVDLEMWMRICVRSSTPLFRAVSEPLVQWRSRPGAISSDEAARARGLEYVFGRYEDVLTPASRGQAYTWPAVLAYLANCDDLGRRWADAARRADRYYWLRGRHGVMLAVFRILGPRTGRLVRTLVRRLPVRTPRRRPPVPPATAGGTSPVPVEVG